MIKKFPTSCPSCDEKLKVQTLICSSCDTSISGEFSLPAISKLSHDDQAFILAFVKSSGSLKVMAQQLGVSYPSVRNRLDDIISKL